MIMVMPVPDSTRLLMFPVAQMNILIIKYNLYDNLKMIGEKKNSYPFVPNHYHRRYVLKCTIHSP